MAEFNPFLPNANIPDWTNAPGRLVDQSGFGDIFANVAKTVSNVYVDQADKGMTKDISNSMNGAWENARLNEDAAKAGLPIDAAKGIDRIKLLNMAVAKGGVSHTSAYAQMEVEMKRLQAKYPNRVDEIQQAYAKATGNTAANDLYKEVESDYAAQTKAEKDAADDVERKWKDLGPWMEDPSDPAKYRTADASTRAEMENFAMGRQVASKNLDIMKDQLQTRKDLREADAETKAPLFVQDLDNGVATIFRGDQNKILALHKAAMADGKISTEESAALTNQIDEAKQRMRQMVDEKLSTPFGPPGQQTTWRQVFANKGSIIEDQMKRFDSYASLLDDLKKNDAGTGYLQITATTTRVKEEYAQSKFADSPLGQKFEKLKVIEATMGEGGKKYIQENYGEIMDQSVGGKSTLTQEIVNQMGIESLSPNTTLVDTTYKMKAKVSPGEEGAFNKATRADVELALNALKDPTLDVKVWNRKADYLFDPANDRWFGALSARENAQGVSQQELAYQAFTDPKVEQMFVSRGRGKQYYDAIVSWNSVYGSLPEDIRGNAGIVSGSGNIGTETASVSFNPDTMQADFRIDPGKVKDIQALRMYVNTPDGEKYIADVRRKTGLSIEELQNIRALAKNTQRINLIVSAQARALKALGNSPDKVLKIIQANLGDLNPGKESPFLNNLIPMIGQYAKDVVTGKVAEENSKAKQKEMLGEDFGQNPTGTGTQLNVLDASGSFEGLKTTKEKTPVLMGNLQADLGLSDTQAAGIVGNLVHESAGLKPDASGDNGAAHGWAQWNGPRKEDMIEWSKKQGLDPSSDEANYAYLLHDLKENYPQVLSMLKKADTVEEATWIIEKYYEKPGVPHSQRRLDEAKKAL